MKQSTKKIIAREGLILLAIISVGFLFIFLSSKAVPLEANWRANVPRGFQLDDYNATESAPISKNIEFFGGLLLLGGYPIYLLIRFIFWAIRILKQDKPKDLITEAIKIADKAEKDLKGD